MISVIIPVINQISLTKQLLYEIYDNTYTPKEVILIDNGSSDSYDVLCKYFVQEMGYKFKIIYFKNNRNIGVNPSWNFGISQSTGKYISILNNDISITKSFFRKIINIFELNPQIGIVVPNTIDDISNNIEDDYDKPEIKKIKQREGWAFTIRKDITDKIPPIPSELNKNFGDDYLFYYTSKLGYKTVKIVNNYIKHIGSVTQKAVKKIYQPNKEYEREMWNKIKNKIDEDFKEQKDIK